jgi:AcrR family transcriptional regulator
MEGPFKIAGRSTPKAEETRARILAAALGLFRERGFDETTMRDIASAAEVAIGAACYYFESKEALVMAFYGEASQTTMHEQIEAALGRKIDLKARLRAVIEVKFEYFGPNKEVSGRSAAARGGSRASALAVQRRDARYS